MTHLFPIRRRGDRPWLLDLFCCAGGASRGYNWAGFKVVGVDIAPRPNYPFTFHQADALTFLADLISSGEIGRFSFIHSSPPCQAKCNLSVGTNASRGWGRSHVDLVAPTRELLEASGLPYVIEQPNGRADIRRDVWLCGEMFSLGVLRHRNFELGGWSAPQLEHPKHLGRVRGWRHGEYHDGPYVAPYGNGGGKPSIPELQKAMNITWTDVREELTEAIPPAYSRYLGACFLNQARARRAA
ncbi:DNA methylase [Streptomyces sp. NPDC085460]|uniref:DNA methylase n=1 Tax=Streptomyces sp. NPDC085460 TaxID=3365723 RepID=UPI0037CFFB8F